ncbi:TRM11 family SAM-dependent methyltransferase [Caldivirga sp. UBA161]|uniref:TRM11 family SAM-dependent methyltransferase n=1 Tax=Caldivirga sp. UBA161 TaxID=1915569 RepID=UPI0025BD5549|nr:hypothetical protein [Caldivirga sp. UBA161]
MSGEMGAFIKLKRLMGIELACLELRTLIRLSGLNVSNIECGDGWAKVNTSDGLEQLLSVINRAALVKEITINGVKYKPTLIKAVLSSVRKDSPHLNPLHALLMINLTGVTEGPIIDPFVGVGTIPKIAEELGIRAIGCDIKSVSDLICNALMMPIRPHSIKAIVTDPPFNRVFRTESRLSSLYIKFLESAIELLAKGGSIVMTLPSYLLDVVIDEAASLNLNAYCIGVDHVHGALSRFILCLSKDDN